MEEITLIPLDRLDSIFRNVTDDELLHNIDELKRLHNEYKESEGERVVRLHADLNRSRGMLNTNKEELLMSIQQFETQFSTAQMDDDIAIYDSLTEFSRRLHNYLAMVHSVGDHGYRVKNKLKTDENGLEELYSEKLFETGLAKEGAFIADLRNYVQHRRIPVVTGRISSGGRNKILFDRQKLSEWDDWKSGEERLMELAEEFEIEEEIKHYHELNTEFYDWFSEWINNTFQREMAERDFLVKKTYDKQQELLG